MACGQTPVTAKGTFPKQAHHDDTCAVPADPFNLLFVNEKSASLAATLRGLKNSDTKQVWKSPRIGGVIPTARNQWAMIDGSCKVQDEQRVTGSLWDRYHIRLWDLNNGDVLACAHHENLLTLGGNPPRAHLHRVDAFESGKDSVCDDFRANTYKRIQQNALIMGNYKRVPYCSGLAALIA